MKNTMITRLLLGLLLCGGSFLTAQAQQSDATTTAHKATIFVTNRAGAKFDNKIPELEDFLTAKLTNLGFAVTSREDTVNSLRTFDPAVASSPRPADSLDAKLTDQSSASRLAQNMGVDYIVIASIASIGTTQNAVNAYGVKAVNIETLMRVTYKILDINGASLVADTIRVSDLKQQTPESVTAGDDTINDLLDKSSEKIAGSLQNTLNHRALAAPAPAAQYANVTITTEAADLTIPDIRVDDTRTVTIVDCKVSPLSVTVEVDGIAAGTAPGTLQLRPGLSKLRLTREGFDTWERTVNVHEGLKLVAALKMSAAGYARWQDSTSFLNGLKNGAKLTDAQVKVLEGKAKMFEQSGFKIDTKDAPQQLNNLSIFKD
jgi:hypothetical protein